MNLHNGRVHRNGFDPDADQLLALEFLEDGVEHAVLGPAVHPGVDGVPVAKALGQTAPLAALLSHIQNGVQDRQVRKTDVAPLTRQFRLDATILLLCDLHA